MSGLDNKNLRRRLRPFTGPQGREIILDGRPVLNFCSNDYLGLAGDPRLRCAAREALDQEGAGAGASRLLGGNLENLRCLEEKIASFKGAEAALVFSSGYMANVGILAGLFGRGDVILSDRLNHASIVDGILLSRAEHRRYAHGDMAALEELLKSAGSFQKRLIVTDSVFSMDGDIAPLDDIVALAQRYDCAVMFDEAHALGVLGEHGRGAVEHFGLEGKVDIQMGTLSKAVGAFGAYVCGSQSLIDVLVNTARSSIYTTALPPAVSASARRGIELIDEEPQRRVRLWDNTRYFQAGLNKMGCDTRHSRTPIIPVVLKEEQLTLDFSRRLLERGIWAAAIRPPTVPAGTSRLRFTVTAAHTLVDLDRALSAVAGVGNALCLW